MDGEPLVVDFRANAASLGAVALRARTIDELKGALAEARKQERTTVIVIEVDKEKGVPGYESWWDVPIAEAARSDAVRAARRDYEEKRRRERHLL